MHLHIYFLKFMLILIHSNRTIFKFEITLEINGLINHCKVFTNDISILFVIRGVFNLEDCVEGRRSKEKHAK